MGQERLQRPPEARPHNWRTGLLRALLRLYPRSLLGKARNECLGSGIHRLSTLDQKEDHPATPWETAFCSTSVRNTRTCRIWREIAECWKVSELVVLLFCNYFVSSNYFFLLTISRPPGV